MTEICNAASLSCSPTLSCPILICALSASRTHAPMGSSELVRKGSSQVLIQLLYLVQHAFPHNPGRQISLHIRHIQFNQTQFDTLQCPLIHLRRLRSRHQTRRHAEQTPDEVHETVTHTSLPCHECPSPRTERPSVTGILLIDYLYFGKPIVKVLALDS